MDDGPSRDRSITRRLSTPVLIDCDPGHDDAMALLLALASPELELLGVTTVHGNQTLDKTTANALRVLEYAGRGDVLLAAGADRLPALRVGRALFWGERDVADAAAAARRFAAAAGR